MQPLLPTELWLILVCVPLFFPFYPTRCAIPRHRVGGRVRDTLEPGPSPNGAGREKGAQFLA